MALRSRRKDVNDEQAFRLSYESEYMQTANYFWTSECSVMPICGEYRGASAFLVCSGPSFNLVDKSSLRYCYTMALNNAVKSCLPEFRPDACCIVDDAHRFLASTWLDPKIRKFVPFSIADQRMWYSVGDRWRPLVNNRGREMSVRQMPNVCFYKRNEKFVAKRYLTEDTINWGCHANVGDGS